MSFKILEIKDGHMTEPLRVLETDCVSGCPYRYKIEEHHPSYAEVKQALEGGNRSVIRCYHGPRR